MDYAKSSATTKGSEWVLGITMTGQNFRIEGYSAYGVKKTEFYNIGLSTGG
jgi:hypothetical protein